MARRGGGNQPDQFNASGRVRTARGGTRNRGGAIVAPGRRARGSTARGTGLAAPGRVITAGGSTGGALVPRRASRTEREQRRAFKEYQQVFGVNATPRTGRNGGVGTGRTFYVGGGTPRGGTLRGGASPGADNARSAGAGRSGGLARTSTAPVTSTGGRDRERRNQAIRELVQRGGTPGERAAAAAAAARLGI